MQFYFQVNDAHLRFITSVGYNPFKHEIVTGAEDGLVKFWELDTGAFISSFQAHRGWVTSFLFWKSAKLMLSSSHDCTIAIWQGNSVLQTIEFDESLYKLCLDSCEVLLMCGTSSGLHTYNLDKNRESGSLIDVCSKLELKEHSGIVRCIVALDNRIYCAGFDKKLVVYDCLYYGTEFLKIFIVIRAHEAAITCLCVNKDSDNNVWITTGGFDKIVKVWNSAGKLVHRIDGFSCSIVDVCAVDRSRQIWVSTGANVPIIYDIKSGEDVSQFSNNFQKIQTERFKIQLTKYFPEIGMVIATTNRRQILTWRLQISSAVTRLVCGVPIDSICISTKEPLLIFCGVQNGQLIQWEKRESNEASFQHEVTKLARSMQSMVDNKLQSRQFQMEPSYSKNRAMQKLDEKRNKTGKRFIQMIYFDFKDILITAAEDGIIYIFGYDIAAIKAFLEEARAKSVTFKKDDNNKKRTLLSSKGKIEKPHLIMNDDINPVTMRITGLTCQQVLLEHKNVVSDISIVPPGHGRSEYFMLSCSWDQRICLWNLENFELTTKFQNTLVNDRESRELAADDVITCIEYCSTHDHFAYASADFFLRICKFAINGSQMVLIKKINFIDTEISTLSWIETLNHWVTTTEDHMIKIWNSDGDFSCIQSINAGGSVSSISYDCVSQVLIAAVGKEIKLFDILEERMVQVYCGHNEDIKGLVILPEKHQFLSAGDDGQLLVWNNWIRPKKYAGNNPIMTEEDSNNKIYENVQSK